MGLIDDMKRQIEDLQKEKEELTALSSSRTGGKNFRYFLALLDNQINDLTYRLNELSGPRSSKTKCDQCQRFVATHEAIVIDSMCICNACSAGNRSMMISGEAEREWGLFEGKIRQDIHAKMLEPYIRLGLIVKSGRYYFVHKLVNEFHYSKRKHKKDDQ